MDNVFAGTIDRYDGTGAYVNTLVLKSGGVPIGVIYGEDLSANYQAVLSAPEPAAWGLMLIGVAGLGATMRRRRAIALV